MSKSKIPTKLTSGKIHIEGIRWLLYGYPKVGKTSLLTGFPNVMFAATDQGYKFLKVYKTQIKVWDDYVELVDELVDTDHKFKTLAVDTADALFDKCSEAMCEKLGIEHESEGEWGRGWSEVKKEFTRVNNRLFQSNMGIVFISHTKSEQTISIAEEVTKTVPTLSNAARKILLPLVDTIGLMRYKTVKTGKGVYKKRLVITFEASSNLLEAGDRSGRLPSEIKLEVIKGAQRTSELVSKYAKKNYEQIAQYYKE